MPIELPDDVHEKITSLCKEGDEHASKGDPDSALERYHAAWGLLPEPKYDWDAATWIFSAIGDAWFSKQEYQRSLLAFREAVQCPGGLGNPFVHLRLGECYYESGNMAKAQDELTRAYMGAGRDIFQREDPKYFLIVQQILKPPVGQSEL